MDKELEKKLLEKYPLILRDMYGDPKVTCMAWGITCGNGWYMLLENLLGTIQHHINEFNKGIQSGFPFYKDKQPIPQVVALQIKEKLSSLTFYYEGGDEMIEGMVKLAKELSYYICEECGTTHNVGQTDINEGVMLTLCEKCVPENRRKNWKKISI